MSLPARPPHRIPLSEKALAAQAAEVERLRNQLNAAQTEGGKIDTALVAQFALTQRTFLEAKIQFEQMRKAGVLVEEPELKPEPEVQPEPIAKVEPEPVKPEPQKAPTPAPIVQVETSPEIKPPAQTETSPAEQKGGRLLSASRVFWLLVIFLLTALLWFMRSRFAGQ